MLITGLMGIAFKSFIGIVLLAMIVGFDKLRHATIKRKNSRLEKIVSQRTQDLEKNQMELRKAHDELEERIKERTAELSDKNLQLNQEIKDRIQAEETLLLKQFLRLSQDWHTTSAYRFAPRVWKIRRHLNS